MKAKKLLLCLAILSGSYLSSNAQTFVPPNLDFELGTTANWTYYTGTVSVGFVYTLATSAATPGLHTLMSGTGVDAYGGFPVVGTGSYSLKLSHDTTYTNADAASYNIAVPASSAYSLIYQYAAVLEDPAHAPSHQPVFEVQAIDSVTGTVFFDSIIYDPTAGFVASTSYPSAWYKAWTNVSVDLSAYAGRTVTMKFFAAACSDGGHWGYAYIDLADLFETYARLPYHATSVTMAGPAGYSSYRWTDSATFGTTYGTTASVTIPAPTVKTKYALILTPASGHGTVDTIYKTIDVTPLGLSNPSLNTGFNLYPNPTSGAVKIQWTNQQTGTAAMEIADVTGRIVYRSALNLDAATGEQQINLGKVADGIYSISIKSDIINYTGKINVQK